MDQVTKVCSQLKREQWESIITECWKSGMPLYRQEKDWEQIAMVVEQPHLFTYMPELEWQQYSEELDDLMPLSERVQEQCK